MFIEMRHLAVATFIICFVMVISVFAATSIVLNHFEDKGDIITGNAVKEIINEAESKNIIVEELFDVLEVPEYQLSILDFNDSLDYCNITSSDYGYKGKCVYPVTRFTLQMTLKNTGDKRIENLKESFFCYDSDASGFWSFFGEASEGAIYDQEINEDPFVAVLEPGHSFVYKLISHKKDIKDDDINCDFRFYSTDTPLQIKNKVYLNFTRSLKMPEEDDKTYLNKIVSSIDRKDLRRLNG